MSVQNVISGLKSDTHDQARLHAIPVMGPPSIRMVPVGAWILSDPVLIAAMAHWRALAKEMYFSQFPESAPGMSRYLSDVSIGRDDVILFIVEGDQGQALGHIGLTHITQTDAEVDSVMRNPEALTPKGLMSAALATLVDWATATLGLVQLSLQVVSYNEAAIALYRRSGFQISEQRPLRKVVEGEHVSHDHVDPSQANVAYDCIVMTRILEPSGSDDEQN